MLSTSPTKMAKGSNDRSSDDCTPNFESKSLEKGVSVRSPSQSTYKTNIRRLHSAAGRGLIRTH